MLTSASLPATSRKILSESAPAARLRGLDGLRAIAVCAVLLYHVESFGWAAGGYLGVDLFFVISGFLITGLLADQSEREHGCVGLPALLAAFYWRRAKRLLPALWLMLAAAPLAAALLAADALPELRADTQSALLYWTNWDLIARQTSYFEAMGRQPLLLHLWSLSIEWQFYLAWGLLALLALPRLGRARMALLTLALAGASVAWTAWLASRMGYRPGQADPSRLYLGTDTHGFQLLLGAALGLLWRPGRCRAGAATKSAARAWPVGLAALAALLALFVLLDEQTAWLYPWGLLLAGTVSAALIWAATHPGSAFGLWLDNRPMRWIGERSYGIYLWHWPIFMLMRPGIDWPALPPAVAVACNIALSVAAAALSWKYVESPIHRGLLERLPGYLRAPLAWQNGAALVAGAAVVCGAAAVLLQAPDQATPAADVRAAIEGTNIAPAAPADTLAQVDTPVQADATAQTQAAAAPPPACPEPASVPDPAAATIEDADVAPVAQADTLAQADVIVTAQTQAAADLPGGELTAVGDSVLLGSSRLLAHMLEGADVHATVGWQASQMFSQLKQLSQSGQLRPVVLVQVGNNGYLAEGQLRQILSLLSGARRVIVVNTHVPRRWMSANNTLIDRVAADYPNMAVADWRDVSDGHRNYFVSDGVHLTVAGQRAFIAEIVRAGALAVRTRRAAAHAKVAGAAKGEAARRAAPPVVDQPDGIPPLDDLLAANL
ncbi:MAG: acyltransferase [Burkholderiaceae bacterium]|nr:acyltransferase [Burkholderiaceae bacterium]